MPHLLPSAQSLNLVDSLNRLDLFRPFSSSQPKSTATLLCIAVLLAQSTPSLASSSSKRGLVDITTLGNAIQDDAVITAPGSDLSWYYNYGPTATPSLASQKNLQFSPMLWGEANSGNFMSTVESQIHGGANITSVLSFNEPDGCGNTGGACMQPSAAASIWKAQLEPLRSKYGIKVGMPAITSSQTGLTWLQSFMTYCDGGCNPDFLTIHYYGDFGGMASWIGQMNASYLSNVTSGMWITEFAYANQDLNDTQAYYNQTTEYLDRLDYIERYSYFGSFRSSVSNVGPNVAMFDSTGKLTAIGNSYMGGNFSGATPNMGAGAAPSTTTTTSGASGSFAFSGAAAIVASCIAGLLAW